MTKKKQLPRMRRWITVFLCLMLTISTLAVFAAGAETAGATLSVSDVRVTAGNYVTVDLRAENFANVGAVDLYAFYDPDVMTVVSSYRQDLAGNAQVSINTDTPGEACFSAISTDGMTGSGYVWSIQFYIKEEVQTGQYPVTFVAGDAFDLSFNPVSIGGDTCRITVDAAKPPVKTVGIGGRDYYDGYKKGDKVTLEYYAYSLEDLAAADFILTYDAELLSPVSVSLGDTLKSTNGSLWSINDDSPGYINISYASLTGVWGWVDPIVTATFEIVGEVPRDSITTVELEIKNIYDATLTPMLGGKANSEISLLWDEPAVVLPEITLGQYEELGRDTFTLSILAPGDTGLAAGDFTLTYDPALLQCTAVECHDPNSMIISNIKQKDGKVLFSFICEDGIMADTELARLTFRVLSCRESNGSLALTGKNLVNADFDSIGVTFGNAPELSILKHRLTFFEAQAPTCEENGWYDYEACSRCGYTTCSEIPALGHEYKVTVTPPTCTEVGSEYNHCTRCDGKFNVTEIPAKGHSFGMWYVVTVPTCTETGTDEQKCSVCGHTETRVTDALGHKPADAVVEKLVEPTCTDKGSCDSVIYCSVCGDELSREEVIIDELGHDYNPEWTVDLAPTCTEVGSKSHHCTRCDAKSDVTEIPANGHSFGKWYVVTPSTCTETGTDEQKCSVCGHTETRVTDALGHKPADAVVEKLVEPTCTDKGSCDSVIYCSVCGDELSREEVIIDELGHDYNPEWTVDLAPTCTEVGSKSHHCTRCDAKFDVTEIPANGHSFGKWYVVTPSTCTETGTDEQKCSVCGHTETRVTDALGHKPADAVVEKLVEPTCTDKGICDSVIYCSVCSDELSREEVIIDELGHDYNPEWTVDLAPTCTEVGSKSHHCTRCDAKSDVTEIPANGHSFGKWYVVTPSTCTETGMDEQKCSVCGHTETRVTDALGHKPADAVVEKLAEPTCTDKGICDSVIYCSVCGDELSREEVIIDELGHDYNPEWTVDLAPTCTEVGSKSHHCTRCDAKSDVTEIPANGHSFGKWYVVTPSTCTETGMDEQKCSVCGHTETRVTDALGHKPADAVVEKLVEPTCTDKGSCDSVIYCSVCGDELSREEVIIDELGHDYESVVTDPTCTEDGYTTHTCRCGDTYTDSEVDALGHTPSDWIVDQEPAPGVEGSRHKACTVCNETLETGVIEALPMETEAETETDVSTEPEVPTESESSTTSETPTDSDSSQEEPGSSGGCSSTVSVTVCAVILLAAIASMFLAKRREENC